MNKNNKPVAIVLGGTNPHKVLLHRLRDRGYYTILVDYLPNPPAKEAADEHIQESTLDKDIVLEITKSRGANLVISACVDQANVIACYVSEKLKLNHPYSYEVASCIGNKTCMKQKMFENHIPTAKFSIVNSLGHPDLLNPEFPLIVKPSDTNGSKGVRRVDNLLELKTYLSEALALSRNGYAIVEELLDGDEIGVDSFISNGQAHIITTHKKRKPQLKDGSVIFSIGSISPASISEEAINSIKSTISKIAKAFELDNVPLLLQVMVKGDVVNVIEFSPRIGGGLNFLKIPRYTGFDILEASVDSWLGKRIKPLYRKPDIMYSENHLYAESGVFGNIEGMEELIRNKTIVTFYPNKKHGDKINSGNASKDRVGSFIIEGKTVDEIKSKLETAIESIKIFNSSSQLLNFKQNYSTLLL